jgi:hypothetical protein
VDPQVKPEDDINSDDNDLNFGKDEMHCANITKSVISPKTKKSGYPYE